MAAMQPLDRRILTALGGGAILPCKRGWWKVHQVYNIWNAFGDSGFGVIFAPYRYMICWFICSVWAGCRTAWPTWLCRWWLADWCCWESLAERSGLACQDCAGTQLRYTRCFRCWFFRWHGCFWMPEWLMCSFCPFSCWAVSRGWGLRSGRGAVYQLPAKRCKAPQMRGWLCGFLGVSVCSLRDGRIGIFVHIILSASSCWQRLRCCSDWEAGNLCMTVYGWKLRGITHQKRK